MDTNITEREVLSPDQALHILFKNKVKITGSEIKLPFSDEGPGIRVWSAVDCLVNRGTDFIRRPERNNKKRKDIIPSTKIDSSCIGSQPTNSLKSISNNIKYNTVKNLKEKFIAHLFTNQPYELGRVLVAFDLKVSHYTN